MNKELSKEEILENWGIFDSNEAFDNANEAMQQFADQEKRELEKENKELEEEIERLTKICNGCFETIHNKSVEIEKLKAGKLNKSNY